MTKLRRYKIYVCPKCESDNIETYTTNSLPANNGIRCNDCDLKKEIYYKKGYPVKWITVVKC